MDAEKKPEERVAPKPMAMVYVCGGKSQLFLHNIYF